MNTNLPNETSLNQPHMQDDDIDVAQLLLTLWEYKKWIVSVTAAFTLAGIVYALLAPPVYYSQATIALKENGKSGGGGASGILSQLGGMGGMVAAQLGMGNTNLDKLEIILKGHELAEAVIEKNDLLPVLFPKKWDAEKGGWKPEDPKEIPTLRKGIERLRNKMAINLDNKKNVIKIGANMHDSLAAKQVVDHYLEALNEKIRMDVTRDAESNREYLEKQLNNTRDPVLMEKIQNMIALEIEKYMLVSHQAFEVLEKPVVPLYSKPNRILIVTLSFLFAVFASFTSALSWEGVLWLKMRISKRGASRIEGSSTLGERYPKREAS